MVQTQVKVKVIPWHAYTGTEWRQKYSSNSFATLAVEGVCGQHHTLAVSNMSQLLYPWVRRSTLVQEVRWAWVLAWRAQKILPPPGFNPLTVQPIASSGHHQHKYLLEVCDVSMDRFRCFPLILFCSRRRRRRRSVRSGLKCI